MLANSTVPVLAASASADPRLVAGGDMLDRRNLAASPQSVSANANSDPDAPGVLRMPEVQVQKRGPSSLSATVSPSISMSMHPRPAVKRPPSNHYNVKDDAQQRTTPPNGALSNVKPYDRRDPSRDSSPTSRLQQQTRQQDHSRSNSSASKFSGGETPEILARAAMEPAMSPAVEVGMDRSQGPTNSEASSVGRASPSPLAARVVSQQHQRDIPRDISLSSVPNGTSFVPGPASVYPETDTRAFPDVKSVSRRLRTANSEIERPVGATNHDGGTAIDREVRQLQHYRHEPVWGPAAMYSSQASPPPMAAQPGVGLLHPGVPRADSYLKSAMGHEVETSRKRRDMDECSSRARNGKGYYKRHGSGDVVLDGVGDIDHAEMRGVKMPHSVDRETMYPNQHARREYRWDDVERGRAHERWSAETAKEGAKVANDRPGLRDPRAHWVLEDPALGEGWDEHGNDLSKVTNEAIRRAHCEAWIAQLQREASAIRSGDHPEVLRRSVLTVKASKRRIEMTEKNSKRQRSTVERLCCMELKGIQASYEAALEQTRERLMSEVNEEIRKSKSRLEGFKEVENRMNTRTTRNNKNIIEDPWIIETVAKVPGNSKRPLCQVSLVLEDDEAGDDIEYLRYGGVGSGSGGNGSGNIGGEAKGGGGRSGGGEGGGGSGSGYYRAYGDHGSSSSSGRTRRPPAWRRAD